MSQQTQVGSRARLTDLERITVLIEEYQALYQLLLFRLRAMDQRIPATSGALGVLLGSVPALPPETQLLFLVGIPSCLAWIVATTVGHARSKEDHLRRIDEIERLVNQIAGEDLLVFQSQHPNRKAVPAGRTGTAAMLAVSSASLIAFAGCLFLFHTQTRLPPAFAAGYDAYVLAAAAYTVYAFLAIRRYRYRRPDATPPATYTSAAPSEPAS